MDSQKSQVFLPDSQPFFNEEESDNLGSDICVLMKRKIENESQSGSQSLLASKIKRRETFDDYTDLSTKVLGGNSNTDNNTKDAEHVATSNGDTDSESRDSANKQPNAKCPGCIFDKELDKRNYHFGNLLIGELQFVPPCMRSIAYMSILKYIDSLKQMHRNEYK